LDCAAINAGFAFRRFAMKPVPAKPRSSMAQVGRFPVTLYKEQWLKLLNMSEEIRAFIAENETRLKAKD